MIDYIFYAIYTLLIIFIIIIKINIEIKNKDYKIIKNKIKKDKISKSLLIISWVLFISIGIFFIKPLIYFVELMILGAITVMSFLMLVFNEEFVEYIHNVQQKFENSSQYICYAKYIVFIIVLVILIRSLYINIRILKDLKKEKTKGE